MSPAHSRYLVQETAISVTINVALSAVFCWLLFGGRTTISFAGVKGYGMDFLPQTFMITLMSVVVPGLLTRKRRREGLISGLERFGRMPTRLVFRAPLMALIATIALGGCVLLGGQAALPEAASFGQLLLIKLVYGAFVALVVTPFGLREALSEPQDLG